ncbi:MAG: response regulator transcription factor [Acidobacteria bacterium]|nr:response regulator transcription factor [Acidobacteriota bacterium]
MRLLIIEDEAHLAEGLRFNLEAEGYEVEVVDSGERGLERIHAQPSFDLLILDVMLPGIDGFSVANQLRKEEKFLPILMLTARGRPQDVLLGFEAGADDYLAKPFELAILLARIKGLLRRTQWQAIASRPRNVFSFAGKRIDFDNLELKAGDRTLRLTLMEANLLRYFVQHQGEVVSRKMILDDVWDVHEDTDTRAIDNFIARLRKYIEEEPSQPRHLLTVRGVGYRFFPEPPAGGE